MPTRRVIPLDDHYKDAVLALLRGAHGEAIADWQERMWHWKIKGNPARSADQQYQVGMVEEGKLLGAITMMPLRVKIGSVIHGAAILLDVVVAPSTQRHGIIGAAPRIAREVVRISPTLTYGVVDERNRKLWERIWGHDALIRVCRRRHRVLALAPVLRRKSSVAPWLANIADVGYRIFSAATDGVAALRGPHDVEVRPVDKVDFSFDALWDWAAPSHPNLMVRDRQFLQWRFEELPDRRYTILGAYRAGRLVGYAVLRLVEEGALRKALIVDLFTHRDETGIFRKLLAAASAEARRQGAVSVAILASDEPPQRRAMRLALFFGDSRSAFMIGHSNTLAIAEYCDTSKWWVTLADADIEIAY